MACSCHGKLGVSTTKTSPFDQCTACAKKHFLNAWSLWNEFTYEDDNRAYVTSQLRNAADHLKVDHRNIALHIRDLAVMLEENRDSEITDQWDTLRQAVTELFYSDHKEAETRLEELRNSRIVDNNINSQQGETTK